MSMSGWPKWEVSLANCLFVNVHSVLSLNSLEASSASMLYLPGQCADDNQLFLSLAHNQMSLVMSLQFCDCVDPCLFMLTTVVVLSL